MPLVSHSVVRSKEVAFAIGNLLPATVLGAGLVALPVRWLPADVVIGGAVIALAAASSAAIGKPSLSLRALRIGAQILLGVGVVVVVAAVLSMAFLAGIHGDFGRGGVTLMLLVTLLVLPYTVVYPLVELWWLRERAARDAAVPKEAAARPATEGPSAA
jgi:hypothetical protein